MPKFPLIPRRYGLAAFFSKIELAENGCWVWRAAMTPNCYGVFYGISAHRAAYLWFVGPIPALHHVDHLCRNTVCVNPAHLEAVTRQENARRASTFVVNGTCKRGHEATESNVGTMKMGGGRTSRYCVICRRLSRPSNQRERVSQHG